jgi:hypothetical protein
LVLGDPTLRGGFGGKPGSKLRQCAEPDDFNGEAIILAVNDPI